MTYNRRRVTVVIPAHNEAAHIAEVIRTVPEYADAVIVVDDGSTDHTVEAARASGDPRLQILSLAGNVVVGAAMTAGYLQALSVGSDVIVKMDADGQMRPEDMPKLLDAVTIDGYAYAKGNRFLDAWPGDVMPRHRLVGNMLLTFLTKLASGYWQIFDPQNGYTAISADTLRALNLGRLHAGFFFENDMLVQLNVHGARVKDVPMTARYAGEPSHLRAWRVGVYFPGLLLQRFLHRIYQKYLLRDFSPIALFLIVGAGLFVWGLGFGIWLWTRSKIFGTAAATGTIMLAIVPLILGFQLLLQAIVLDIQQTPR